MEDVQEIARELERIVPQNLSEWPSYAQALHLQMKLALKQIDSLTSEADDQALKIADQGRRIESLEAWRNWIVGAGTAIAVYVAGSPLATMAGRIFNHK